MDLDLSQLARIKEEAARVKTAQVAAEKAKANADTALDEANDAKAELTAELHKTKDTLADLHKAYDATVSERTRLAEELSGLKLKNNELAQLNSELKLAKVVVIAESEYKVDIISHLTFLLESQFSLLPTEVVEEVKSLFEAFGIPFAPKKYNFSADEEATSDSADVEGDLVAP